jgi:hypothetical protein
MATILRIALVAVLAGCSSSKKHDSSADDAQPPEQADAGAQAGDQASQPVANFGVDVKNIDELIAAAQQACSGPSGCEGGITPENLAALAPGAALRETDARAAASAEPDADADATPGPTATTKPGHEAVEGGPGEPVAAATIVPIDATTIDDCPEGDAPAALRLQAGGVFCRPRPGPVGGGGIVPPAGGPFAGVGPGGFPVVRPWPRWPIRVYPIAPPRFTDHCEAMCNGTFTGVAQTCGAAFGAPECCCIGGCPANVLHPIIWNMQQFGFCGLVPPKGFIGPGIALPL